MELISERRYERKIMERTADYLYFNISGICYEIIPYSSIDFLVKPIREEELFRVIGELRELLKERKKIFELYGYKKESTRFL